MVFSFNSVKQVFIEHILCKPAILVFAIQGKNRHCFKRNKSLIVQIKIIEKNPAK